ncbi:hypothetical protein ABPG74_011158 [Tetrahymena malaccensis]
MGFCSYFQTSCINSCKNLNPFSDKKKNKVLPNYANDFESQQQIDENKMRQSQDYSVGKQKIKFETELSINTIEEEIKQEGIIQDVQPPDMNSTDQNEQLSQELNSSFQNTQLADLSKFVERVFDPSVDIKQQYDQMQINLSKQPSSQGSASEYRVITFCIKSVKYYLHAYKILLGQDYVNEYKKFKNLRDLHQLQQEEQNARDISIKSISKDDCIIHYFLLRYQ